jgi:hypothetical protein
MITYGKFQPTGFDCAGLGLEDQQDWFVCPCAINRDSGILEQANWETQKEILEEFDSEDWEIHRFGHWANGWFEIVIVHPESAAYNEMYSVECALSDYPVLDESKFSRMEFEEKCNMWSRATPKERREWLERSGLPKKLAYRKTLPHGVEIQVDY